MSNSFIRIAAFTVAAIFAMSSTAMAQSKVLVIDTVKVVKDSTVGKYAETQLNAIGKSMQSELKSQATPYQSKTKSLSTAFEGKKTMAEINQTLQARPDLQQAIKDVKEGEAKLAQESQIKSVEFQRTEQKAYAEIAQRIKQIIDQVAVERGADVVLDKNSTVLYVSGTVDITQTVLSRLNSQMTTVTITRERIPRTQ